MESRCIHIPASALLNLVDASDLLRLFGGGGAGRMNAHYTRRRHDHLVR